MRKQDDVFFCFSTWSRIIIEKWQNLNYKIIKCKEKEMIFRDTIVYLLWV